MRIEGSFLQSKVARRVFALFVLTASIPIIFLSVFSHHQVSALLIDHAHKELEAFNSVYGSAAYDRLLVAESTLSDLALEWARGSLSNTLEQRSRRIFRSVAAISPSGDKTIVFGNEPAFEKPGGREQAQLQRGETVLQLPVSNNTSAVVLVRAIDAARPNQAWIAGDVSPEFLWGNDSFLPYMTGVCVLNTGHVPLHCSNQDARNPVVSAMNETSRGSRGRLTLRLGESVHLAAYREVFVASRFSAHRWVVVTTKPEAVALAPASVFSVIFWGSVVLSALVVTLLSVSQIRRILVPLERLIAGTRRLAKRDFSARVEVKRGDEFGELADTFNAMATRLGRQFAVLTTLSRIDRSILTELNIDRTIDEVLSRLRELVGADFTAVFVLNHGSERDGRIYPGPSESDPDAFRSIAIPDGVRDTLLAHQDGLWNAAGGEANLFEAFGVSRADALNLFILPITWKNRLSGAVLLGYRGDAALDDEDVAHVRDFADRVGVVLSTTAREAQLHYQARYDALTDLPNRFLFTERLTQEISRAERENRPLALLFIALDRFKHVNDTLGHAAGDALLRETGVRLRGHLREGDTLSRFGGDEFTIVLSGASGPKEASVVAEHVIAALAQPFLIEQVETFITASIGIALYPGDGATAPALLRSADTACANASGRGAYVYFTESMNSEALRRASVERELRRAIEQRQFILYYQPKVELDSGRISSVEALVRWRHPERGIVDPGAFIDVAEDTGLIAAIGEFALLEGCRQFGVWRERAIKLDCIAINASSRQLRSASIIELVRDAIAAHELRPGELELEVTESLLVDNYEDVARLLGELRSLGAMIALDDFGTGYSSMRYLERLPFDTLKIDISFVRAIRENGEGGAIAACIIAMARSLNKKVVAEGVETLAQADFLRRLGCDIAQGYYYGRPLPPAEFEALFISRQERRPVSPAVESG